MQLKLVGFRGSLLSMSDIMGFLSGSHLVYIGTKKNRKHKITLECYTKRSGTTPLCIMAW